MAKMSSLEKRKISWVNTIILCVLMVGVAAPLYVMVVGAFKNNFALSDLPPDLNPFNGNWWWRSMETILVKSDVLLWLRNSFIIAISVAVLTTFIGMTAGYSFARLKFYGKKFLFALVIATMIMPKAVLMVPNFLVAKNLGLVDNMIGVILTTLGPAFAVFLSRQCIQTLPNELFEAAELDGTNEFGKFFKVAFPLTMPSMGAATIFAFFGAFNDFTWQLIMISDPDLMTTAVGISTLQAKYGSVLGVSLAGSLLVSIPLLIIFLMFQKVFIKGATVGAVKG